MASRVHSSYVNGKRLGQSGRAVVRRNPGRLDREASRYYKATAEEAMVGMDAAASAYPAWSDRSVKDRVNLLQDVLNRLEERSGSFAKLITSENGKTLAESKAEVTAGLADARYHLNDALRARNAGSRSQSSLAKSRLELEPVGVYVLITPWNFPLATILRKVIPALAFGNTAVVKPAGYTSATASLLFDVINSLRIPAGVANLILGSGSVVGPALLFHESLRGISFTGSTENGLGIARSVAGRDVRLQLEMGGKNSLVVLADADIDKAVDAAVIGAFSCAGQWCTGTGRAIVEERIYPSFCQQLIEKISEISVGPGDLSKTKMGPLISSESLKSTREAIRNARGEGARVAYGGKAPGLRTGQRGHFLYPTVLTEVDESMAVFSDELFAPVLPVIPAKDFEDSLRLANAGKLGLSASIFTCNKQHADRFLKKVEAGIAHVNLHTAFRSSDLPVAAWRDSGRGTPECGRFARDFYTRPRSVYVGA